MASNTSSSSSTRCGQALSQTRPAKSTCPREGSWNDMYFQLSLYKSTYGHCDVPEEHADDGLGEWVKAQRKYFSSHNVYKASDADRVRALIMLGFDFQVANDQWESSYQELVEFRNGNPDRWPVSNDGRLGHWINKQRSNNSLLKRTAEERRKAIEEGGGHKGSPESLRVFMRLSQQRIDKLNALGFVWSTRGPKASWDERFAELEAYKRENGHCVVPQHYKDNKKLGEWVTRMRYQHGLRQQGKKNQLSEERVRRLDEVGFRWHARRKLVVTV